MKEKLKKFGRIFLQGVVWIFILSIQIDNKSLFHYGHSFFVDNKIIHSIDSEARDLADRIIYTAKTTFKNITERKENG